MFGHRGPALLFLGEGRKSCRDNTREKVLGPKDGEWAGAPVEISLGGSAFSSRVLLSGDPGTGDGCVYKRTYDNFWDVF